MFLAVATEQRLLTSTLRGIATEDGSSPASCSGPLAALPSGN